jgi:hypothetical protein
MLPGDRYFQTRVSTMADILAEGLLEYAAEGMTTYVSHIMGERFPNAFNLLVKQGRMPIRFAYTHWAGFAMGYADSANFYRRMGDMLGHGIGDDRFFQVGVGLGAIDSAMPRICSSMEARASIRSWSFVRTAPGRGSTSPPKPPLPTTSGLPWDMRRAIEGLITSWMLSKTR